jgi:hypothetical protein
MSPADRQQVADALEDDAEVIAIPSSRTCSPTNPNRFRTRSFASTPTQDHASHGLLQQHVLRPALA